MWHMGTDAEKSPRKSQSSMRGLHILIKLAEQRRRFLSLETIPLSMPNGRCDFRSFGVWIDGPDSQCGFFQWRDSGTSTFHFSLSCVFKYIQQWCTVATLARKYLFTKEEIFLKTCNLPRFTPSLSCCALSEDIKCNRLSQTCPLPLCTFQC